MSLLDSTRRLLDTAVAVAESSPAFDVLAEARDRLDDPIRVAVAGGRGVGKSTLVNALVGESVAPTGHSGVRIPIWYGDGSERVGAWFDLDGGQHDLPVASEGPDVPWSLDDVDLSSVNFVVLELPNDRLARTILIDTPGLDPMLGYDETTPTMFDPAEGVSPVDAVIYLFDHHHPDEDGFLDAFADQLSTGTAVNAIGVVARADQFGGPDLGSVERAQQRAAELSQHPRVVQRVGTVVAVSALMAEGAGRLSDADASVVRNLAELDAAQRDRQLLSAALFVGEDQHRSNLLDKVGIFGVRVLVDRWLAGNTDPAALASGLVAASGLPGLLEAVARRFEARSEVLRCRSALAAVSAQLGHFPVDAAALIEQQLDDVLTRSRELIELDSLDQLDVSVPEGLPLESHDLRRLLGAHGADPASRLGLDPGADPRTVADVADQLLGHFQSTAEQATDPSAKRLAAVVVRTLRHIDSASVDAAGG